MHTNEPLELSGKLYRTVLINQKVWMAENLAVLTPDSWAYEENALYNEQYGRLYTWDAAMKACPSGWHLPTDEEWAEMVAFLGGDQEAFHKLIAGGSSGMEVLYAGYRSLDGNFLSLERAADFWSGSSAGEANAWLRYMIFKKDKVFRIIDDKRCGFSVRYVKD